MVSRRSEYAGNSERLASQALHDVAIKKVIGDVSLLGDVADALKHAILTHRMDTREVSANEAVLVLKAGYGRGGYGEGKYGGYDQVLVLAKSGQRPLTSILQNVIDAWRRAAGLPLPAIGKP